MIPGAGTRDIEQVPFCVVNLLQFRVADDALDSLLEWNDSVIARHDDNCPELQSFGHVHRADRDTAA